MTIKQDMAVSLNFEPVFHDFQGHLFGFLYAQKVTVIFDVLPGGKRRGLIDLLCTSKVKGVTPVQYGCSD